MKPIIGITGNFSKVDFGSSEHIGVLGQNWDILPHSYIETVEAAGGTPVILPLHGAPEDLIAAAGRCDGILFSGGSDISPICYGENVSGAVGQVYPHRDSQEIALARYLIGDPDTPVLGICRGAQLINVALGGTLYQDLDREGLEHSVWGVPLGEYAHRVTAEPGSRLAGILGEEPVWVNSYHHQAVRRAAPGLAVTARAEDGVAEAVELPGERFFLAVQWHPEMLPRCENAKRVLSAFVQACQSS